MNDQKGLALRMAAHLIAESKKNGLDSAILDTKDQSITDEVIDGAKRAESYLDVPLKDRPRDPFMQTIPHHLDKPLRSLLGFIDDGLPEYSQQKFWEGMRGFSLSQKIDGILSLAKSSPTKPVDMIASGQALEHIKDESALKNISYVSSDEKDQALRQEPQSLLKSEISQKHWDVIDKTVLSNVMELAHNVKSGIPQGLRPDAVPIIMSEVSKTGYELLARRMLKFPTAKLPLSIEPKRIASIVMASDVLGEGIDNIAKQFPALFSIVSGLSVPPLTMMHKMQQFLSQFKKPVNIETVFQGLNSGKINFITVHEIDNDLFEETAKMQGMHPEEITKLSSDIRTSAEKPFISSLISHSEDMDRKAFADKQAEVRKQVMEESVRMAQKQDTNISPAVRDTFESEEPQEMVEDGGDTENLIENEDLDIVPTSQDALGGSFQEENVSDSHGWQKDSGRPGIEASKGDDIVTKLKSGKFKAWKADQSVGEFDTPEQAIHAIEAI